MWPLLWLGAFIKMKSLTSLEVTSLVLFLMDRPGLDHHRELRAVARLAVGHHIIRHAVWQLTVHYAWIHGQHVTRQPRLQLSRIRGTLKDIKSALASQNKVETCKLEGVVTRMLQQCLSLSVLMWLLNWWLGSWTYRREEAKT